MPVAGRFALLAAGRLALPAIGRLALLAALLMLLMLPGCAVRPPVGEELVGRDRQGAEEIFAAAMASRDRTVRCLDAEAELSWRTVLRSGVVPGYLLALAPDRLRFIGVDPLGRPALALVTDGVDFRMILVGQGKAYQGATSAAAFRRHLPEGLAVEQMPDYLFAWLSGGWSPAAEITGVYRDHEDRGYWLEVAEPADTRLLFDPAAGLLRRVHLFEPGQRRPTEIIYDDYRPLPEAANRTGGLLPHRIELDSRRHQGLSLTLTLSDLQPACDLTEADFYLPIPPRFTVETVE